MSEDRKLPPESEDTQLRPGPRIRKLTPVAEEHFEQKCNFYYEKINNFTKQFDKFLVSEELEETQKTVLLNILKQYKEQYTITSFHTSCTPLDQIKVWKN